MNILKANSFFDMCISENCLSSGNIEETIKVLNTFGYRTIAINYLIDERNIDIKRKKNKGDPREILDPVPNPDLSDRVKDIVSKLKIEHFNVLNRLTITFSNQDVLHKISKSPNFKKFHIIAVLPTSMQAFMADIFTIDPETKFSLRLTRKFYNQLVNRGYSFELLYSSAIEDSTKRKNLIYISHLYHSFGKSRNIIFSSGAQSHLNIRSPYDVINLGFIFGLSEIQCKNALTHWPRNVIINSVARQHGKSIMLVENFEKQSGNSVIMVEDSEDEDMILDQPAQKKSKI